MSKCKHNLVITLSYGLDHTDGNEFKKFLGNYVSTKVSEIQRFATDCGMRTSNWGGIIKPGQPGEYRNIEMKFDCKTQRHDPVFNDVEVKLRNYRRLIEAVQAIDKLVGEIPLDCKAKAVVSMKNYRTPWVQIDAKEEYLMLRKGYYQIQVNDPLITDRMTSTKSVTFYGEPRTVYKVYQAYKLAVRTKASGKIINNILSEIHAKHKTDNWICVWNDGERTECWGPSKITRTPIWGRAQYIPEFRHLEMKYPERGNLFTDVDFVKI